MNSIIKLSKYAISTYAIRVKKLGCTAVYGILCYTVRMYPTTLLLFLFIITIIIIISI